MNSRCPICGSGAVRSCTEYQTGSFPILCQYICIQNHHWHIYENEARISVDCNNKYGIDNY